MFLVLALKFALVLEVEERPRATPADLYVYLAYLYCKYSAAISEADSYEELSLYWFLLSVVEDTTYGG